MDGGILNHRCISNLQPSVLVKVSLENWSINDEAIATSQLETNRKQLIFYLAV